MNDRETTNKLIRLLTLIIGFGTRRITDDWSVYFAFNGSIFATGYDFKERDKKIDTDGNRKLPRPQVYNLPPHFDEIYRIEIRRFVDGSFEHVGTQYADDAPLDHILSVYEAAYAAAPFWIKALVIIRSILGRLI